MLCLEMKFSAAVIQENSFPSTVIKQEAFSDKCGMQENLGKDYIFLIAHTRICFLLFNFLLPTQTTIAATELDKFLFQELDLRRYF